MSSFGEKLRHERESRDTAIEEIAGTTKIQLSYLEALEQNEFDALPGPAFGKLYIRAYAEVLGFDPRPLIDDYDRERQQRGQQDSSRRSPRRPEPTGPEDRARARQERFARVLGVERPAAAEPAREAATAESETEPVHGAAEEPASAGRAPDSTIETRDEDEGEPTERERSEPFEGELVQDDPPPVGAEVATAEPLDPPTEEADEPSRETTEPIGTEAPQSERPAEPVAVESGAAPFAVTSKRSSGLGWSVGIVAAVVLLVVIVWISTATRRTDDQPAGASVAETPAPTLVGDESAETPEPAIPPAAPPESGSTAAARPRDTAGTTANEAEPVAERERPPDSAPVASDNLSVSEFGVGRRIVNHRLEGRAERFEEGSVVWFSTRVLGGRRGEQFRHVWFRNGKAVQSIELTLGGPHWRTHSSKTLWGTGDWRVEARDAANRVLASTSFDCVPPGS